MHITLKNPDVYKKTVSISGLDNFLGKEVKGYFSTRFQGNC